MESKDFNVIVEYRINSIKSILSIKEKEYATECDRLHNFKRAASILNTTPEKALVGMFVKHMVSILDIVDSCYKTDPVIIDEKIGDAINYLILLEAILKEHKK